MTKSRLSLLLIPIVALGVGAFIFMSTPASNDLSSRFGRAERHKTSWPWQPSTPEPATAAVPADEPRPDVAKSITLSLYETSTVPVNAVQATVVYPADKLELTTVDDDSTFDIAAATDRTAGRLRVARATAAKDLVGRHAVTRLTFTVTGQASAADVAVETASSLLISTADNDNVLPAQGSLELR